MIHVFGETVSQVEGTHLGPYHEHRLWSLTRLVFDSHSTPNEFGDLGPVTVSSRLHFII